MHFQCRLQSNFLFENFPPFECNSVAMFPLPPRWIKTTAVVIGPTDSHGALHGHLFKQEIYENYCLLKANIRETHAVLRWFSHSYLSPFLLSVERQEAQSAGVKQKVIKRSGDVDSQQTQGLWGWPISWAPAKRLRQEHQLLGINTSLLDDCWWNW